MGIRRWAFLPNELADLQACRADDEFVAYPPDVPLGVIVYRDGTVSNRWGDGTAGIPPHVEAAAGSEDTLYRDTTEIDGWRNVEVDDSGRPVRLCEVTA